MAEPCDPCDERISCHNPSDFSGGFVPTPTPTRQRVCNTEQTASCPDGSNPQVVAAETFCITVLNPTADTLAQAQTDTNAMALAQAESEVGDCAWANMVWTCTAIDVANPHVGATTTCAGNAGNFAVSAFSPVQAAGVGVYGVKIVGTITFSYKVGQTTHHNVSGTIVNALTGVGGLGVRRSEFYIYGGVDFAHLILIASDIHDNVPGLGTFAINHDFTNTGVTPWVYQIEAWCSVYCEEPVAGQPITHTQSITGLVKALD